MGYTVLLMVDGCAGMRSEAPEERGHTEATVSEEARCSQTRTVKTKSWGIYTTNDMPGCLKGGLLSGTDGRDNLDGHDGDDEIHGLGDKDRLLGGFGSDVLYDGPGDDSWLYGERGDDVIYGGDGNVGGRVVTPKCTEALARTTSMAGMATISCLRMWISSETSSIAVKAGTAMLPTNSTKCRAVARRNGCRLVLPLLTLKM